MSTSEQELRCAHELTLVASAGSALFGRRAWARSSCGRAGATSSPVSPRGALRAVPAGPYALGRPPAPRRTSPGGCARPPAPRTARRPRSPPPRGLGPAAQPARGGAAAAATPSSRSGPTRRRLPPCRSLRCPRLARARAPRCSEVREPGGQVSPGAPAGRARGRQQFPAVLGTASGEAPGGGTPRGARRTNAGV